MHHAVKVFRAEWQSEIVIPASRRDIDHRLSLIPRDPARHSPRAILKVIFGVLDFRHDVRIKTQRIRRKVVRKIWN